MAVSSPLGTAVKDTEKAVVGPFDFYKRRSRSEQTFSILEISVVLRKMEFFNSLRTLHSTPREGMVPCRPQAKS
jgi:hypothetical protein